MTLPVISVAGHHTGQKGRGTERAPWQHCEEVETNGSYTDVPKLSHVNILSQPIALFHEVYPLMSGADTQGVHVPAMNKDNVKQMYFAKRESAKRGGGWSLVAGGEEFISRLNPSIASHFCA